MKKFFALFLSLMIILCFAACSTLVDLKAPNNNNISSGENTISSYAQEADNVIKLINAIGNVTINSGAKITDARSAFNSLSGAAQNLVSNIDILLSAEQTYTALKAAQIDELINDIGIVSLNSKDVIDAAVKAYDDSTSDIQLAVQNKHVLDQAQDELAKLQAAEVDALIKAIGKVTLKSEEKITKAENALNSLSSRAAALVTNKSVLISAKSSLEELKRDKALSNLTKETDKVEGITWYLSKAHPKYINTRCYVLPYIGVRENSAWLRLKINYTGDNWIFFTKVIILVDGERYFKTFSYFDIERDNAHGDVWETADVYSDADDIELLKKIASSKETIVRFEGDSKHKDITIKDKDKQAIKEVLAAYEYLCE